MENMKKHGNMKNLKNMKKKKRGYGVELSTLVFLLGFQGLAYLGL
jgi:hypothetical protein